MDIHSLPFEGIDEAIALITSVFPRDASHIRKTLNAYRNGAADPHWQQHRLTSLHFWAMEDVNHMVGIIGLYEKKADNNDACWLSWFCVTPEHRSKGMGRILLEHVIAEAQRRGKHRLRLYTSTAPEEAIAQRLYDERGFIETSREAEPGSPYERIYRELNVSSHT